MNHGYTSKPLEILLKYSLFLSQVRDVEESLNFKCVVHKTNCSLKTFSMWKEIGECYMRKAIL